MNRCTPKMLKKITQGEPWGKINQSSYRPPKYHAQPKIEKKSMPLKIGHLHLRLPLSKYNDPSLRAEARQIKTCLLNIKTLSSLDLSKCDRKFGGC